MPLIIAHRGLHARAPENSLGAMCAAWDAGMLWCECDVHLSADGTPFVIHDETLDRTTTGLGRVAEYFQSDLKSLRLKLPHGEVTGEALPTLDEIIAQTAPRTGLLVEIKPVLRRRCFRLVDKVFAAQGMVQSFHRADVDLICRVFGNPGSTALLLENPEDLKTPAGWVNLEHSLLSAEIMQKLRDVGKKVGVWTVNKREDMCRMIDLGVDAIITDEPVLALKIAG